MSKITKTTLKSFIKKNANALYFKKLSRFDGSVDCTVTVNDTFNQVTVNPSDVNAQNTLGIKGLWVTHSGNLFTPYDKNGLIGIEIYNCCGNSMIATKK